MKSPLRSNESIPTRPNAPATDLLAGSRLRRRHRLQVPARRGDPGRSRSASRKHPAASLRRPQWRQRTAPRLLWKSATPGAGPSERDSQEARQRCASRTLKRRSWQEGGHCPPPAMRTTPAFLRSRQRLAVEKRDREIQYQLRDWHVE
jgi:hypothetical protein